MKRLGLILLRVFTAFDWPLLAILMMFAALGLTVMHSAVGGTDWRFAEQSRNFIIAFFAMWTMSLIPPKWLMKLALPFYVVGVVLLLAVLTAAFAWNQSVNEYGEVMGAAKLYSMGGAIGGLVLALITIFKKEWSPVTAPMYALGEGLFLGAVSALFNMKYPGIVFQAVLLTFGTLAALLFAYRSGVIKATENFKMGVVAATGGIALLYLASFVLGFFNINVPH
ncbi:hypothetical protein G6F62_013148 [Rhizopus arrhizus]|nr:hypothetical protein G6F62_013148 [Rhizopus arrhizus]